MLYWTRSVGGFSSIIWSYFFIYVFRSYISGGISESILFFFYLLFGSDMVGTASSDSSVMMLRPPGLWLCSCSCLFLFLFPFFSSSPINPPKSNFLFYEALAVYGIGFSLIILISSINSTTSISLNLSDSSKLLFNFSISLSSFTKLLYSTLPIPLSPLNSMF